MAEGTDVYVRFEGIRGECTDEEHPGSEGWFQITRFGFNFGVKESGDSTARTGTPTRPRARTVERRMAALEQDQARLAETVNRSGTAAGGAAGTQAEGPHEHPDVSLEKALDVASHRIWREYCYGGKVINSAELQVCRSGGLAAAMRVSFVRLIFGGVYVKSVSMTLSDDSLPTESMTFQYERVKMESVWTDNETGEELAPPRRFGWDFQNNRQWTEDPA